MSPHNMKIVNNKPVSQAHSIEKVRNAGFLKLKDIREFVEKSKNLDENTPVVIDRIEDSYFLSDGKNGWKTLKVHWSSDHYQKSKFSFKDIEKMYKSTTENPVDESLFKIQEDSESITVEQYSDGIPANSIHVTYEKDSKDPVVFITPHY